MIKLFKNIINLSLTGKIALIHSFLISFFYIFRKNNLGFDERTYILASLFKDNEQVDIDEFSYAPIFIINHGYFNPFGGYSARSSWVGRVNLHS